MSSRFFPFPKQCRGRLARGSIPLLLSVLCGSNLANADDLSDCRSRKPDKLLAACSAVIKSATHGARERAEAYRIRGSWLSAQVQWDQAMEDLGQSLKLEPKSGEALFQRGMIQLKLGKTDDALLDLDAAIAAGQRSAAAYAARAEARFRRKEYPQAMGDADQAILLKPDVAAAYTLRGMILSHMGNLDRAIVDHDRAVALRPTDGHVFQGRGHSYDHAGKIDLAIADYDRAIALDPTNPILYAVAR